jgi:hypothetical protein
MADTYAVYVKFREVRQDLMAAVISDALAPFEAEIPAE